MEDDRRADLAPQDCSRPSLRLAPEQGPQLLGEILAGIAPPVEADLAEPEPDTAPVIAGGTPAVLLCQCGSAAVDVNGWVTSCVPIVRCYACGNEARLPGFTIGRYYGPEPEKVLQAARSDAAVYRGGAR